jgi:hypothetical protein
MNSVTDRRPARRWRVAFVLVVVAGTGCVAAVVLLAALLSSRAAQSVAGTSRVFSHIAPDGTEVIVTEGDVTFWGNCNCWSTARGVLIEYTTPSGGSGSTVSLSDRPAVGPVAVEINHAWSSGPSFVSARVGDGVGLVRVRLTDGRWDEQVPVGGWVVFASSTGVRGDTGTAWTRLEAVDRSGATIVSCLPVPGAEGCTRPDTA